MSMQARSVSFSHSLRFFEKKVYILRIVPITSTIHCERVTLRTFNGISINTISEYNQIQMSFLSVISYRQSHEMGMSSNASHS